MSGFVSGVVKGGVLAVIGLAVLSEVLPPPHRRSAPDSSAAQTAAPKTAAPKTAAPDAAAPTGAPEGAPVKAPDPTVEPAAEPPAGAAQPSAAEAPEAAAPKPAVQPAQPEAAEPKAPEPEDAAAGDAPPQPTASEAAAAKPDSPAADAPAAAPDSQPAPAADGPAAAPPPEDPAKPAADAAAVDPQAPAADAGPDAAVKAEAPAAEPPAPKAGADEPTADPEPDTTAPKPATDPGATGTAPDAATDPGAPGTAPDAAEDAGDLPLPNELPATSPLAVAPPPAASAPPEPGAPTEPLLDRPEPGLDTPVEGVTTGRLPTIDAAPPAEAEPTEPEAPAAEVGLPEVDPGPDAPPVIRYAAPFANPQGKPLYAVILIDDGSAGLDRETLAKLPLPITIALDPAQPDAAAHAALYRAAGKEIAMLASGLPKGAKPADIAVTFDANARALPETVAVIDLPKGGFQNDRPLSSDILPVIRDQGRGIVTFDVGLNAADQVARREGVPAAVVFRQLDAEGEGRGIIRRYLDRAAFKAAQDGRVTVLGTASPETLAALVEWSVEGRAGSVALAPLSAVLTTGN